MQIVFSFILCAYNPDVRLLKRVLNSILQCTVPDNANVQYILVNNNSNNGFEKDIDISKLLLDFLVINEIKQGLSNARIAGVNRAEGNVIVFVDDDNQLENDYLIGLTKLLKKYPAVGIWGPAIINVDFIDGAEDWVRTYMMEMFQYKQNKETKFGCETGWPNYYPVGSGIVILKEVFELYYKQYKLGNLTVTGRKGDDLSSGEDSQIVWTAVKNNYQVGTSERLQLTHIISAKRVVPEYLTKLNFNISYSFYKAQYEMFSDINLLSLKPTIKTKLSLLVKSFKKCNLNIKNTLLVFKVEWAWYKGYNKFYNELSNEKKH